MHGLTPPDQHVGVQEEPHRLFRRLASQVEGGNTGRMMSPRISTVPASVSCGQRADDRGTGIKRATGRPRFRMVTDSPVRSTSSSTARHLALNSDALSERI